MRKLLQNYFLFMLKPSLMTLCFTCNLMYLKHTNFVNNFYFFIYLFTFLLKPIFYLILLIGLIKHYQIRKLYEILITWMIVLGIFFGFPVKEYSEILNFDTSKRILIYLGEGYVLHEYLTTHYVVNLFMENLPVTLFIIVNNIMLENKFIRNVEIEPVLPNLCFILINGLAVCLCVYSQG
jgi:hypothetical protein